MARDRQRSKQRQAERRAARLAARQAGVSPPAENDELPPLDEDDPRGAVGDAAGPIAGETGAPPENVGRSDTVAASPPPAPIVDGEPDGDGEIFPDELEPSIAGAGRGGSTVAPGTTSRGGAGKVLGFLTACWAELQRVQWPDRRTLTQLTGIVLFFVIIAGAYLGVLDQIFSKLIQAIL